MMINKTANGGQAPNGLNADFGLRNSEYRCNQKPLKERFG
jgi:hypothetical protein